MSARKYRVPVVLDTNVFVRNFKSRSEFSPNRRIVRLWLLQRTLQLIVSDEVVAEYLEIFHEILAMDPDTVEDWRDRFANDPRSSLVKLARRDRLSRDPDDSVFLSTARAGKAKYLVTNDRDLLDLPQYLQKTLPFAILTPYHFLKQLEGE
jgi:putative PIN family toxin of toxin-antitoxin system